MSFDDDDERPSRDTAPRTRIKICGLREPEHVHAAVQAGADAVGFVCYPPSVRHVASDQAIALARLLPPEVTPVFLFVNAAPDAVQAVLKAVPRAWLQFHGDETPAACEVWGQPYLRAVPMQAGVDLLDWQARFPLARALLLDAPSKGYGGSGRVFDWTQIQWPSNPSSLASSGASNKPGKGPAAAGHTVRTRLVLSGGLRAANVIDGMAQVRPWAVDVSSGVESSPGVKDIQLIAEFCAAVRHADATIR